MGPTHFFWVFVGIDVFPMHLPLGWEKPYCQKLQLLRIYAYSVAYPRFLLNVSNDDVLWLEEFSQEDQNELEKVTQDLIEEALSFFDQEIEALE